jgi:hypothetical protein
MRRSPWLALLLPLVWACGSSNDNAFPADGGEAVAVAENAGDSPVAGSATLGGRTYALDGDGECRQADEAYIYGVASSMWLVQYRGSADPRSLTLTIWRPRSGGADQLSLAISAGDRTSTISTVRGGTASGSGTVEITPAGEGAHIVFEGRDGEGTPIHLDLRCDHFSAVEAVGG